MDIHYIGKWQLRLFGPEASSKLIHQCSVYRIRHAILKSFQPCYTYDPFVRLCYDQEIKWLRSLEWLFPYKSKGPKHLVVTESYEWVVCEAFELILAC